MLQYIGARYVPIFYQNSLDPDSSAWEANVTYEPMTWVELSNGHMYISKKEVPANIGTPASNPAYWLEAGQYNAYIQSLQNQIDDINNNKITAINNRIDGIVNTDIPALDNRLDDLENIAATLPPDYDSTVTYSVNDYVIYNGKVYQAIANSTGITPTNTLYWIALNDIETQFNTLDNKVDSKLSEDALTPTEYDVGFDLDATYGSGTMRCTQIGRVIVLDFALSTSGTINGIPANTAFHTNPIPCTHPQQYGFYLMSTSGGTSQLYRCILRNNGIVSTLDAIPNGKTIEGQLVVSAAGLIWTPKMSSALPYVFNHRLVCNQEPNNPQGTSSYIGLDVGSGNTTKKFTTKFIFENRGINGTCAMIFTPNNNGAAGILAKSIHVVMTNTYVSIALLTNSNRDFFAEHSFGTPMALDGVTEHTISIEVTGNTVITTVDGVAYSDATGTTLSDYYGRYAVFEFFCLGARAFCALPEYTYMKLQDNNGHTIEDNFNRADGQLTVTPDGIPYNVFNN